MKVTLIYPCLSYPALGNAMAQIISSEAGFYPPLGLLYLAGYLETYTSHELEFIDALAERMDYRELENRLKESQPDVVGIYFTTFYLYDSILTARIVKKVNPEIFTVAGGPHVYLYPYETVDLPEIDYVVFGEGEIVFKELVESLDKKDKVNEIPGVLTKTNRNRINLVKQRIPDLDQLPFPARHLSPYKKYSSILAKRNPITTFISSRGCPYNCYFCDNLESGQKVRFRSPKNVVDELESSISLGIYDIFFFDELFTLNRKRVFDICDEIISRSLPIRWHIRSRADTIDEAMVKKLKQAGCRLIQFGIESGSSHIQKVINKKLDLELVEKNIKMVRDNGILTYADFMFGLPEESSEEMKQTVEFATKLNLDYAWFSPFHTLPETEFYRRGLDTKKIKLDYWKKYLQNLPQPIEEFWWPDFNYRDLSEFLLYAYRKFYIRPEYFWNKLWRTDSLSQLIWQAKAGIKAVGRILLSRAM
jgi:radical SAM superfamily enzyme YgiQ (UPF0313 family)